MELLRRFSQVFGLAVPCKDVSWRRIVPVLIFLSLFARNDTLAMPFLKATIKSISDERVTLVFENGVTTDLPSALLEGAPHEGADVRFRAAVLGGEDAGQTHLAKELINEILAED